MTLVAGARGRGRPKKFSVVPGPEPPQRAENEPFLVSKKRATVLLGGVTTKTVDNMLKRGDLIGKKIGRRMMIRYDSVKRFCVGE